MRKGAGLPVGPVTGGVLNAWALEMGALGSLRSADSMPREADRTSTIRLGMAGRAMMEAHETQIRLSEGVRAAG